MKTNEKGKNELGANRELVAKSNELKALMQTKDFTEKLGKVIGRNTGLTPARLVQQTLTMAYKTPDLLKCSPVSILLGVTQAAELGLELAGPLGQAWLIPRYDWKIKGLQASFQVGYKGYIQLAFRSQQIKRFTPRIVYAEDFFERAYGSDEKIVHVPPPAGAERGEPVHYYAMIEYLNGGKDFHDMSKSQVLAHRMRYSPPPADREDKSAWATSFDAMALKTCCGFIGRRSPIAVEFHRAASIDGEIEAEFTETEAIAEQKSATQLLEQRMMEGLSTTEAQQPEPVPVETATAMTDEEKKKVIAQENAP
jgi:recombination protein RecT